MAGDKSQGRRFILRSKLSSPKHLLVLVVALKVFAAKIELSSSLAFIQRDSCVLFPRLRRFPLSSSTIFVPNMTSKHNDYKDDHFAAGNQSRSKGNRGQQRPQKHKDSKRPEATTNAAPMYITIGPQCSGKSTLLRDYEEGTIKDISLDDQQDVYVPIPTETFLLAYNDNSARSNTNDKGEQLLQQVYQGSTLRKRIQENTELILILRRWNGDLTASDFEDRIKLYYDERKFAESVALALIKAVEDFLLEKPDLPKNTDVFVLESLFKPHPQTRQSAIQRAYEELRETPMHVPVAWGNTNSKPRDYERALEICHQTRRPVHFILCHPAYSSRGEDDIDSESELITLPWIPLEELLKRNLHRLQIRGRFVPANAIADCCQRVTAMIPANMPKSRRDGANTKMIEERLVEIASPSTGGRGGHRHDNRRPNAAFRYSLTKHRLIQKEYPRNNVGRTSSNHRHNNQSHNFHKNNEGSDSRHRNQNRYNERTNNRRRDGEDDNMDSRYQSHRPPDQEDAPPRSRRKRNY